MDPMTDPVGTFVVVFTGSILLFLGMWWFSGRKGTK